MDQRVLQTQEWLNDTYTGVSGYTPVTEDGATGHQTFTALIKALQIELGIAVDGDFGPGTLSACPATISQVPDESTATPINLHYIIQGSMWCKGYNPGGFNGIFGASTASGIINFQADAGITQDGVLRPYILQALMNTDGYALDPNGDAYVREVQTGLNSRYGATIGLSPSNGIWGRVAHKNLIKSAQIEWGATPADGIFGDGTLSKAPTLSRNTSGYTNSKRILQWALCINGYYPGGFTGTFGTGTYNAVYNFQDFACIGADGIAGKKTWASLMRSCGDTTRSAGACDCATILTASKATTLANNGYNVVGRYLTGTIGGSISKALTRSEINIIFNAGLRFFPIYQTNATYSTYFTYSKGSSDARAAITAAENLGIPTNTIIYFAVDFDAVDDQVTSSILPYFSAVKACFDNYVLKGYRVGIYGARNICTRVCGAGYAASSFVGDMSTGYSGNLGYKLPDNWAFDQFYTTSLGSGSGYIEIDKDAYSGRDEGVDHIVVSRTVPAEDITVPAQPSQVISADPINTSTGAHLLHIPALSVKGAQELSFELNYNSTQLSLGTMGKGWSHNYEMRIAKVYDSYYIYWTPSTYSIFTLNSSGTYSCSDLGKQNDILTVNTDGSMTLNRNNDMVYSFSNVGQLTNIQNRFGMNITISEDESENLILIEAISGKTLTVSYDTSGYIGSVADQAGRTVAFSYDANACLTTFTNANGQTNSYTYDSEGRVLTGTDGDAVCCFTNTYDSEGRIISQLDALEAGTTFDYDDASVSGQLIVTITNRNGDTRTNIFDNTTKQMLSVTDENGNTTTYTYDSNGNMASETDALEYTEATTYDARNHPLTKTDRGGLVTTKIYDSAGNLLTVVNPDGGTISYTYDSSNRVISETDARGTITEYAYNTNGLLTEKDVGLHQFLYTYGTDGLVSSAQDANGGITNYAYDAAGRVISITDASENETAFVYDDMGNKLSETDPLGNAISFTYNSRGLKLTKTDANANVTTYSYNGNGKLAMMTDPKGNMTTYTYDNEDRPISVEDALGNTSLTAYDAAGRVLSDTNALGNVTAYTYDSVGNLLTTTEPNGGVTSNTYNAARKPITITDPAGNTTAFGYDLGWRMNTTTNALGKVTTYAYNSSGDLLSITDPLGNSTAYTYDAYGNILTVTDPNSDVTAFEYDDNNNKILQTDALGNVTDYVYDAMNRLTQVTDANNHTTATGYDENGRAVSKTDALGNTVSMSYDANGNVLTVTDALDNVISSTTYDSVNLPAVVADVFGNEIVNSHNALGALSSTEDPLGNITSYGYDAVNRMTAATDALDGVSSVTFDDDGNITAVEFPSGGGRSSAFDTSGRCVSESTPSGGTISYTYNALNLIASLTNARSQVTSYTYDDAGRIAGFTDAEGTTSLTYDAKGNLLTITDEAGTITREYDELNRVVSYTDVNDNEIQYTYDAAGNLSSVIYPDGKTVAYTYNAANRLVTVTDWASRVTSYTYDANGKLLTTTRPDGSVLTQTYDDAGRLTSAVDVDADSDVIVSYSYAYDANGRLITEDFTSAQETASMAYDVLNRLTGKEDEDAEGNTVASYAYVYDADGNITSAVSSQQTASIAYDTNDRLTQYNSQNAVSDLDGNLTSCLLGGSAISFSYDSANRLIQAGSIAYSYDAQNNRISSAAGTQTTEYVVDPVSDALSRLLVRTDPSGNNTYYVYGIGLIGHQDANGYGVYHFDLRGSTVALTDADGTVTDRYAYGAYGEQLTHTGTSDTPFNFCGQYGVMTDANGLYYMRARYYAPEIKRFLNVDSNKGSINDSKALNLYTYASDSPIIFIDPQGTFFWAIAAALVGAVVGVASTFVSDVVANIATNGKAGFSSLETYIGSAVGGAVEGVVTVVAGPVAGGAAGNAAATLTKEGIEFITGKDDDSVIDVIGKTVISSVEGAVFGKYGEIKVKGYTVGRNSNSSIFKSGITKLKNKTARHMSLETARKGYSAGMLNYETLYEGGKEAIGYYLGEYENNEARQAYSYK